MFHFSPVFFCLQIIIFTHIHQIESVFFLVTLKFSRAKFTTKQFTSFILRVLASVLPLSVSLVCMFFFRLNCVLPFSRQLCSVCYVNFNDAIFILMCSMLLNTFNAGTTHCNITHTHTHMVG